MPTHQLHDQKEETYFTTFTCYNWIPLFETINCYDYFNKWFTYLNKNNAQVLGYVIMPNHFHGLIHVGEESPKSINEIVSNAKRFLAYEVVKRLEANKHLDILRTLQDAVPINEQNKGKKHQVFKPSFDAKPCFDLKMLEAKLDYIHANPVSGKWNLVEDYVDYPYSSARFYELGESIDFVTHYREIWG